MVQAAQDRMRHATTMYGQPMPLLLQGRRQTPIWLGYTRPQGHVRATFVVMASPLREDTPHMICRQGNQIIQIPPDLVVKSQATDIIDIILQLIRRPNSVHMACSNGKSRGALLSTS